MHEQINSAVGMEHIIEQTNLYEEMVELYWNASIILLMNANLYQAQGDRSRVQRGMFSGFWQIASKNYLKANSYAIIIYP